MPASGRTDLGDDAATPHSVPFATRRVITLGPFRVDDLDRAAFLDGVVTAARTARAERRPAPVFALHVGGLNLRRDRHFVDALSRADLLVADGISVAALLKLAGASGTHRHPTTDCGWQIIDRLGHDLGRPARVALVGGPDGLARRAADVMAAQSGVEVVATHHGYHSDWTDVLDDLRATGPDLVVVGMGMPHEALWTATHLDALPPSLVLTCGGWFGHIVGDEKRAPAWMRSAGLEWLARLAQQPGRLWKRYTTGLFSTLALVPTALRARKGNRA